METAISTWTLLLSLHECLCSFACHSELAILLWHYFLLAWYPSSSQARREPQRGPGNHYHGALSQPYSVCAEIEEETWGLVSPHRPRGLGEHHKLPQRGLRRSPAENGFYAYLRSERSHLEHPFRYFWAMEGPPKYCGARENFHPSPPPSPLTGPASSPSDRFRVLKATTLSNIKHLFAQNADK